jgi:type VI secretion system protein ImpJ
LPQRPNTHYFQIDTRSRLWQDVIESEALALYWDTAPKDVKLEIFVLEE